MDFLFTALQRFRLLSLTVAWVAGVVSILLAEPSGPVAAAGAYAFGLFILLTVARLRWDSLVILSVLAGATWFLVGAVPGPEDILAGDRSLCVMAPTQSSNSSFSWSTLKEARTRLFFCARRKPANDIQQI